MLNSIILENGEFADQTSILPSIDSIEAAVGVSDDLMDIAAQSFAENEQNWFAIDEYLNQRLLQESVAGRDYFTEGFVGDFFNQLKEWLVALYKKIVALFKKFISLMDSYVLSDKEFVKKYQGELLKMTLSDKFKFNGYKFTIPTVTKIDKDIASVLTSTLKGEGKANAAQIASGKATDSIDVPALTAVLAEIDNDVEGINEAINGVVYGGFGGTDINARTSKELRQDLFELYRDGNSSKTSMDKDDINLSDCLNTITNYKDQKKTAENNMKEIKRILDAAIKAADNLAKDLQNLSKSEKDETQKNALNVATRMAHKTSSFTKRYLTTVQAANAILLSALKAENRQAKNICVKALAGSKTAFNDNANMSSFGESTGLQRPKLI